MKTDYSPETLVPLIDGVMATHRLGDAGWSCSSSGKIIMRIKADAAA